MGGGPGLGFLTFAEAVLKQTFDPISVFCVEHAAVVGEGKEEESKKIGANSVNAWLNERRRSCADVMQDISLTPEM